MKGGERQDGEHDRRKQDTGVCCTEVPPGTLWYRVRGNLLTKPPYSARTKS